MKTEDLHRHVCDVTGKGMSEGWYINNFTGKNYFANQEDADNESKTITNDNGEYYKSFKDLYNEIEDADFCYWTNWYQDDFELEDEGFGYDDNGNLYEFKNNKWVKS